MKGKMRLTMKRKNSYLSIFILFFFVFQSLGLSLKKNTDEYCKNLRVLFDTYSFSFCDDPNSLLPLGFSIIDNGKYRFLIKEKKAYTILLAYANKRASGIYSLQGVIFYSNKKDILIIIY
jgi:hypothetical protein